MAEPDTLPPDPFAPEKLLHHRMSHKIVPGDLTKAGLVAWLAWLGVVFLTAGVAFLEGAAWALVVFGAFLLVGAVAAYRTLEDEDQATETRVWESQKGYRQSSPPSGPRPGPPPPDR